MSELDKKIQKSQPDLVQAVLEAQEKRNVERIDVLITNALKQLKMSRFKPDQAICLSLIYLARVSPKSFSQSSTLKDLLKTHLRRDNGPANLKATIKNDFILPVLAANILLACSDTSEVRALILRKIEQWLSTNQKITENVQHLLAILCVKCQGDQQTVQALIELRQHWFHCLDSAPITGGSSIAVDLCIGIRNLLHDESNCQSLIENLTFLLKHDRDICGLCKDISRFIIDRPITLKSMLADNQYGKELKEIMLLVYSKLFSDINEQTVKKEDKKEENSEIYLYYRSGKGTGNSTIDQSSVEALLSLLATIDVTQDDRSNSTFKALFDFWLKPDHRPRLFQDPTLESPYCLPLEVRCRLIQSDCDDLVTFGIDLATKQQLIEMVQRFGNSKSTLSRIFKELNNLNIDKTCEIKDPFYFRQLLEYLIELEVEGASIFRGLLEGDDTKSVDVKTSTKIKLEA